MPKVPKITSLKYQYFKENVEDEVDLLPAQTFYLQKYQRLLQIDITILSACEQTCPK